MVKPSRLILLILPALFFACTENSVDPDQSQNPGFSLSGQWIVADASAVSGPVADDYADFAITFTLNGNQLTYSSNSIHTSVFPASGSFEPVQLSETNGSVEATRAPDKVPVTFTFLSDDQIRLEFVIGTASTNGRTLAVDGSYSFTLSRNNQ